MLKRILAHLVFWPLIVLDFAVCSVVVVCLYFPFIALKAVWTAIRGGSKTEPGSTDESSPRMTIG